MKNVSMFLIVFLLFVSVICSVANAAGIVKTYPVYSMNGAATALKSTFSGATEAKKFGDIEGYVYWQIYDDGGSKVQCRVYSEVKMQAIILSFVGFGSIRGTPDTGHTKQFAGKKVDKRALDAQASVEVISNTGIPLELKVDRFKTWEKAPKDIRNKYGDKETFRFTVPNKHPYVLYTAMQKHPVHKGKDWGTTLFFWDHKEPRDFDLNEFASLWKQKTKAGMTAKEMADMFSPYAQAHGESLTQFGKTADNAIRSVTVDTNDPEAPKTSSKKKAAIDRGEYNYGILLAAEGVYTAYGGDTHEAVFYLSNTASTVKWYVQSPSESGRGTLVETDTSTDEARFSYTFANDASGSYVITAVVTPDTGPGYEDSYTVSVSGISSTLADPSPPTTPSNHACGIHDTSVSGDHSYGTYSCGVHSGYLCQTSSDHSTTLSGYSGSFYECQPHTTYGCGHTDLMSSSYSHRLESCPTNSNGDSCTSGSYYACQSHTHSYPAPKRTCWRAACDVEVSGAADHKAACGSGNHSYWPGCPDLSVRWWHQRTTHTEITCKRCGVKFRPCSNTKTCKNGWGHKK